MNPWSLQLYPFSCKYLHFFDFDNFSWKYLLSFDPFDLFLFKISTCFRSLDLSRWTYLPFLSIPWSLLHWLIPWCLQMKMKLCSFYICCFYIFSYFFKKNESSFFHKNYLTWLVEKIEILATIKFSTNITFFIRLQDMNWLTTYFNHKTLIHYNLFILNLFNVCIQVMPKPIFCGNYLYVFLDPI